MAAIVCTNFLRMVAQCCASLGDFSANFGQKSKEGCILCGQMLKEHTILFQEFLGDVYMGIVKMILSPFFPYLAVTYVLNLPPFIFGIQSMFNVLCESKWLITNTALTASHIVMGSYMVYRIRMDESPSMTLPHNNNRPTAPTGEKIYLAPTTSADDAMEDSTKYVRHIDDEANIESPHAAMESAKIGTSKNIKGAASSWERIRFVMCYDMTMAFYYVLFAFWIIWQAIGTATILNNEHDQDCGKYLVLSIVFGFLYMGLVVVALICSICFLRYRKISEAIIQQQQGGIDKYNLEQQKTINGQYN